MNALATSRALDLATPTLDLSPWVIPETGNTKIGVGSRRPGLRRAITGRGR